MNVQHPRGRRAEGLAESQVAENAQRLTRNV